MTNHPIPDDALDDRLFFGGTAGSGKTYNAMGRVERLLAKGHRVVIPDPLGVWWGLRLNEDGKTASRYDVVIFGGPHGDLPLNEHAGALIGETVAGMKESCIIDLSELGTKAAERRFMYAFTAALYRRKIGDDLLTVVFDEADMWAPQQLYDKEGEAAKLLGMMETIVRRGRIKGFVPWLISQRPAVISKNVLSQVDGIVAFKLTSVQDRDAIGDWVEGQADKKTWKELFAQLAIMQRGQGLVWIPGRAILETVQFPVKKTFDSSRAPKRGEKAKTAELQPLDLPAVKERLAKVEAEVKANDPKALRRRIIELERLTKAAPVVARVDAVAEKAIYDRGYEAGAKDTSIRDSVSAREGLNRLNATAKLLGDAQDFFSDMEKVLSIGLVPHGPARKSAFQRVDIPHTPRAAPPPPAAPRPAFPRGNGHAGGEVGSGGLRRILIALAQRPDGLTNRQIGVRASLSSKSGTFSTYISKGRSSGWIADQDDRRVITQEGLAALGAYDPLPAGRDLLDHWLRELGASGAARLLSAVAEVYPKGLTNAEAGERANLSHASGTFSTYLSKLRTLELITGRGEIRASDELFS